MSKGKSTSALNEVIKGDCLIYNLSKYLVGRVQSYCVTHVAEDGDQDQEVDKILKLKMKLKQGQIMGWNPISTFQAIYNLSCKLIPSNLIKRTDSKVQRYHSKTAK